MAISNYQKARDALTFREEDSSLEDFEDKEDDSEDEESSDLREEIE